MKSMVITLFAALSLGLFATGCNKKNTADEKAPACCQRDQKNQKTVEKEGTGQSSIYQMGGDWVNQDNQPFSLDQLKGKVQLVAMIFTHCGFACPRMVENIKQIESELPANLKNKIGYTLVSFDVERDNPKRLKQYTKEKGLGPEWTLLHGSDDQVRVLSMLLNIQYNQLSDGSFNHSNVLTILDENGAIVKQLEGLDIDTKNVVDVLQHVAQS